MVGMGPFVEKMRVGFWQCVWNSSHIQGYRTATRLVISSELPLDLDKKGVYSSYTRVVLVFVSDR